MVVDGGRLEAPSRPPPGGAGGLLRRSWDANKPLTLLGVSMLALLLVTVPLILLDAREITGVRAWIKPTKFAVSGAVYAFTFLWMLSFIRGHRRLVGIVAGVTAGTFFLEMLLIVTQVMRGTTSHFNNTTPFDSAVFGLMGALITVFWVMAFVAAVLLVRQRLQDKALAAGIRAGLALALAGMAVAFLMLIPTDGQREALEQGRSHGIIGAHAVGPKDGGPGLPLVDWSTVGGDLRVPHFVGLHALQILPLTGWLLQRRSGRLGPRRAAALVRVAGLAYLGLIGLLTWQALRGQSVVAPDTTTLAALAGLVLTAGLGALAVLRLPGEPVMRKT